MSMMWDVKGEMAEIQGKKKSIAQMVSEMCVFCHLEIITWKDLFVFGIWSQ
jgi:hypothetical protein